VLANHTVPVGGVFLVKEVLDELRDLLLGLLLIDGTVDLLLNIILHVLVHLADDPSNVALCHFL
jgi:hypothetical protein